MSTIPDGTGDPPSLRDRNKRRTRDRIYGAALALFAERPYDEVTVDAICAEAEVGRATFFRFYGVKAGLLSEFGQRLAEQIARRIDDHPDATATEQLWMVQDEISSAWGQSAPSTREMAREYIRNATADELSDPAPAELVALVADVVRGGQDSGEFTRAYDPDFMAWIVLAALSYITAGWLRSGDDDSLVRGTRDTVAFLLHGLHGPTSPDADPR
jgi:AcrR family transcriptional regulator